MNKGRGFQRGWWLVLVTIGVMYTASVPFIFVDPQRDSFIYMLCEELVLVIPLLAGIFMLSWENLPEGVAGGLGLCGFPRRLLPLVLLLPAAAQGFSGFMLLPVQNVLALLFDMPDYSEMTGITGVESFLQNFLVMCVAAPIIEELLCRGVLMQLFRRYGIAMMLIYSSLAFALMHLSAASLIPIFFLGLMLGIIRITSGSIYAPMIAHSVCNLYSLLMLNVGSDVIGWLVPIAGIVVFPILMYRFVRGCDESVNWRRTVVMKNSPVGFSFGFAAVAAIFFITNMVMLVQRFISGALFYEISGGFY